MVAGTTTTLTLGYKFTLFVCLLTDYMHEWLELHLSTFLSPFLSILVKTMAGILSSMDIATLMFE